jgi:hypothetical protein
VTHTYNEHHLPYHENYRLLTNILEEPQSLGKLIYSK